VLETQLLLLYDVKNLRNKSLMEHLSQNFSEIKMELVKKRTVHSYAL